MRPSLATLAAVLAASLATLSQSPVVSAAPALLVDPEVAHVGHNVNSPRIPIKMQKREEEYDDDEEDDDDEVQASAAGATIDYHQLALDEANSAEPTVNALAADYGYGGSDTSSTGGATVASDTNGTPAEAGSAPESWDVVLYNPNDPLFLNQGPASSSTTALQIGAPTDVNVDATASATAQVQVGAPTDINLDGTATTTTSALVIGAPTDVNVDGTTTSALVIGAPTDVNVDGTTTTTVYATPTPTEGGGEQVNNGGLEDFQCLEVIEDSCLKCKDVQSIDESQFNCVEDIDFGTDYVCTDHNGDEFDCTPEDGQTAGSDGSNGGSSTDPTYNNPSDSSSADAAALGSGATSSWKSSIFKTGVVTAFVMVASAAFFL